MSDKALIPIVGECDLIGKRYVIKTLKDLYEIPSEKLVHCLADVCQAILFHKLIANEVDCLQKLDEIDWVDDGKHDLAAKIEVQIK